MGKKFEWDKKYVSIGVTALAVIACSILFFYLLTNWRAVLAAVRVVVGILSPFIVGFLISYILYKPMGFF